MNEHITKIANNCFFDPAEFTWVYISMRAVADVTDEEIHERLLANGDYAAPIRTKDIKQPFEKMAIVVDTEGTLLKTGYMVFTCDCKNSTPALVKMWGATGAFSGKNFSKRNPVSATIQFQTTPEMYKKYRLLQRQGVIDFDMEDVSDMEAANDFLLIGFPDGENVPVAFRDSVRDKVAPMLSSVLAYIACVSTGCWEEHNVDFYRPTNAANNQKRRRKGKAPLYEWRTVSIEKAPPALPSAPKGGTHASPRLHQRRGHWVTSKLGKRFWRSESVVGKAENGMIFHDYVNKGVQDAHVQA